MCSRTVVGQLVTTALTTVTSHHVIITSHPRHRRTALGATTSTDRQCQTLQVAVPHLTAARQRYDRSSRNPIRRQPRFSIWHARRSAASAVNRCSLKNESYRWTLPSAPVRPRLNESLSACSYSPRHETLCHSHGLQICCHRKSSLQCLRFLFSAQEYFRSDVITKDFALTAFIIGLCMK